jgi:HAD superfamily hydrolase (TIGR01509 family)
MSLPDAVLWDMDGTLVDSEPYWIAAEFALALEHGATWTQEDALRLVGHDLTDSASYIRQQMGLALSPSLIVEYLLDRVVQQVTLEVPWVAGARELLAALGVAGVPNALVTMSYTRLVAPVVAALPPGTFGATITGDKVARGKPHPEPYLAAARALGVDPARCLAIEDSTTGATSAAAAGCSVLVVPNHVTVAPAPGLTFIETLVGLTPANLPGAWS